MKTPNIFAVDFDGTCVEHQYPEVGPDVLGAVEVMKALVARGDKVILWTMRSGRPLLDAKQWFKSKGVPLWGVNANPEQDWTTSPKAYAQVYIDDAALGCPLLHPVGRRPFVDWFAVKEILFPK